MCKPGPYTVGVTNEVWIKFAYVGIRLISIHMEVEKDIPFGC